MSLWDEGLNQFLSDLRNRGVDEVTIEQFLRDKASPEETRKSCQSIQVDAGRKYGAAEVAGQKIPAKWVSMIMDNINRFVSITDYAMKGAPETVGLAWFAIKQVLNAVQNNYKLYGFFGGALGDITEMLVIIRTYDKLYDERSNSSWKASEIVGELFKQIKNVYHAILDFSFSVKKHLSAGKISRIGHALKDAMGTGSAEFEGKMGSIKTLKIKILESAQTAFQQKTFVKFDEVQETINMIVEGQESSLKIQQAIQQSMEDIAKQTKPKSRDDWAKQEFEKNKKSLNPLPASGPTYAAYRKQKHPGTCDWVFENETYKSWRGSAKSEICCVAGDHGNGKSVLLATITNQLEVELKGDTEWVLQYLSCETLQNSTSSDSMYDASVSATRIQYTIISNFYDRALEGDASIQERCNAVFQNPKLKKVTAGLAQHQKAEDHLPEFEDALEDLAQIMDKKLLLIIDAVDVMSNSEEQNFAESLQELLKKSGLHVRVLVSCLSGCKFFTTLESSKTPYIPISELNRDDIKLALGAKLKAMPGWSEAEQEEALQAIIEKSGSGSDFKYALQVAIPFLQEPWQRPLSARLKQLPGGVNETYSQAISQMAPNYRALLQTSLTWALLADGPVTVTEVMDAHLGIYLGDQSDFGGEANEVKESALYKEQIRTAGGPFLDCHVTDEQSVLKLKDPASVRRFFLQDSKITPNREESEKHVCDICKREGAGVQELAISEKDGHLALAILLIKHLNSPLFHKRHVKAIAADEPSPLVVVEDVENNAPDSADDSANKVPADTLSADTLSVDTLPVDTLPALTEAILDEHNKTDTQEIVVASQDEHNEVHASEALVASHDEQATETTGPPKAPSDTDESQDSIDRSVDENEVDEPPTVPPKDTTLSTRYEFRHWFTHVRKTETLWPLQSERDGSENWHVLLEQLDSFSSDDGMFNALQQQDELSSRWTPLQAAARYGLVSMAERLLDKGADIMDRYQGLTPLHLASYEQWPDMLSLLLSRGADPNFSPVGDQISPFHYFIILGATGPIIKKFLDHGASTIAASWEQKYNVLHFFAWIGIKPEDLYMLLDHVNENGEKVDINVLDEEEETPLHKLMSRSSIPIELLKAFVERGADVNKEDKESQRPLYQAAWQGELEAMKVIIDKVTDINDDDIRGRTAIHNTVWMGHIDVLKFLVSKGASYTHADKHNRSPFMFACLGKSEETARYLLDLMIQDGSSIEVINMKTKTGRTPLRQASAKGFVEIVKLLLERITDVETIDAIDSRKGRNALHCASFRGKHEVVSLLLARGANANLKDGKDKTALQLCHAEWAIQGTLAFENTIALLITHDPVTASKDSQLIAIAAVNGSKRILEMMHSAKADLDTIDRYGWTPLLLARQYRNIEAEEFLSRQTKPTRWEVPNPVITVSASGAGLTHPGGGLQISIVANRPISSGVQKYYYEVSLPEKEQQQDDTSTNPIVAVGFCTLSDGALLTFPGWKQVGVPSSKSWAWHGDDGALMSYVGWEPRALVGVYGPGDVIGCGVDFGEGRIWWTRNGVVVEQGLDQVHGRLFPVVGLEDKITLVANFGVDLEDKPFMWKEGMAIK